MKTIVVPVNFSSCSANAARYAADLALALRSDLHLIHVIQVPLAAADMMMTEYVYQEMVDSANASLQQLKADLAKRCVNRVRIETSLEAGNVASKVKDLCKQLQPYAIVLGASGPTLEKFLAGSPVASLLHNLTYPVLVVPETASFHHFRRVLLACDLEDIDSGVHHSLPLLKDIRSHFGSRFDIVTVETHRVLTEEQKDIKSGGWKEQLKELYPEIHYICMPGVEEGILEYLGHHDADLVMVFPKRHRLFDFHVSQSRKLAKHSLIPVMSLHE